jgi:hypothetical protein
MKLAIAASQNPRVGMSVISVCCITRKSGEQAIRIAAGVRYPPSGLDALGDDKPCRRLVFFGCRMAASRITCEEANVRRR